MQPVAAEKKLACRRGIGYDNVLVGGRKRGMAQLERGFTLVEALAVVALIGILALMAVPSFQDRIIRQQIEAALPLAEVAKKPVAAAWALTQTFPPDNQSIGLPVPEKIVNNYVSALQMENGAIHLTFGNRVNKKISGKVLTLRPAVVPDAPVVPVAWVCGNAEAPQQMTAMGSNRTDIPDAFLPLECLARVKK